MTDVSPLSFEPAYRQLDAASRAVVDGIVARVDHISERTGRQMFDVLGSLIPTAREAEALQRPLVKAAVFDRVRAAVELQNISPRKILKELSHIAFSSIDHFRKPDTSLTHDTGFDGDMLSYDGGLFELDYATPEQRSTVRELVVEESVRTGKVTIKLKLHDKIAALKMLGQIQGLFDDAGNAVNPAAWAEATGAGIPVNADVETAGDLYAAFLAGDA